MDIGTILGDVTIIAICVVLYAYRKVISKIVLERPFKANIGPLSIEAKTTEEKEIKVEKSLEGTAIIEEPTEEQKKILGEQDLGTDHFLDKMIDAFFFKNDIEGGKEAFKKLQQSETDPIKMKKNEVLYFYFLYKTGDPSALGKLYDLAKQKDVSAYAQGWIGACYEEAGNFLKASEEYEIAAQYSDNDIARVQSIISSARNIFEAGKPQEAYDRLMLEIGRISDFNALSELYKGLALLYEKAKDSELQAIALEKAMEFRPNDTDALFKAAYSFSQKNFRGLSLLHYKNLLNFQPENDAALNNIGVQYERMDMPINAVNFYKRAIESNSTLAAANLADRYIEAGLKKEAEDTLRKASEKENHHVNVDRSIVDLSEKEGKEKTAEQSTIDSAKKQQRYILKFADAYFIKKSANPEFQGKWKFPDGVEIDIKQNINRINANWKRKVTGALVIKGIDGLYETKHRLEGNANNKAAKITMYDDSQFKDGYAYISEGGDKISIMMGDSKGTWTFLELEKVV